MSKKNIPIFLLQILLLLALPLTSALPREDPLGDMRKQIIKENKPGILYLFKKYCTYCEEMERDVLSARDIKREIKRTVVFERVSADRNPSAARRIGTLGYPTTVLFDESGKRIIQIPGYIPKRYFKKILEYLSGRHYKNMSLKEYLDRDNKR